MIVDIHMWPIYAIIGLLLYGLQLLFVLKYAGVI
jgi:hypothetical protein